MTFPLEHLSWRITQRASLVSQYLRANDLPQPSFERDGPTTIVPHDAPQYIRQAQHYLISASLELFQLATGPSDYLPNLATGVGNCSLPLKFTTKLTNREKFHYISCISWLCQYDIFHLIPLDTTISYADLAAKAQVPEQRLKSIVRMAMTNFVFREQPDGKFIGHSATSALIAQKDDVHTWASYMCANSAPMAMQLAAAHRRWGPGTVKSNETAYNVAFNTDLPFFEDLARDEARTREFAGFMRNVTSSEGVKLQHLLTGFAWPSIREGGVVVDVSSFLPRDKKDSGEMNCN